MIFSISISMSFTKMHLLVILLVIFLTQKIYPDLVFLAGSIFCSLENEFNSLSRATSEGQVDVQLLARFLVFDLLSFHKCQPNISSSPVSIAFLSDLKSVIFSVDGSQRFFLLSSLLSYSAFFMGTPSWLE